MARRENQSIETDLRMIEIIKLANKDLKITININYML